jgi:hypothetical protein
MKIKIKIKMKALALFISVIVALPVVAQPDLSTEMNEYNKSVEPFVSLGNVLQDQIEAYFKQLGVTEGIPSKTGKTYYSDSEVIAVGPESPDFIKASQIAFDKAFNKARAKFIFDRYGREIANSITEVLEDGSTQSSDFSPDACSRSQLDSLYDKVAALTDSKLNKALEANGVDPAEFQAASTKHRKTLFLDKTLETITRRASGDITGILPVKTFFAQNDKGTARVGVIMVYSPTLVAVANDIRSGKNPSLQGKVAGKPIADYVNVETEQLLANFGPRLVFDENANPIILSYAQWGSSYNGNNERQQERSRDLAFSRADMQASQLITEFINGSLSQESKQVAGQFIHRYLETDCKDTSEIEINNLVDEFSSKLKINASAKVSGSTIVKRWSHRTNYGSEIIGVVRAWSPQLTTININEVNKLHQEKTKQSINDIDPESSW